MAFKIPQGFKASVTIGNFRDAGGRPAVIDSITSVTVSDPSKSEVINESDGTYSIAPRMDSDPVGDGQQVMVDVDVRVGPEVKSLILTTSFDVPAGEATEADVTFGPAVPR